MSESLNGLAESTDLVALVQQRTAELEYRKRFEQLLVALSTRFVSLPFERLDEELTDAVEQIGRLTEVDRCFIYQINPDGDTASLTHEWCAPGVPQIRPHMQGISIEPFAWEINQLSEGRTLVFRDTSRMPREAAGISAMYQRLGVRSAMNVPLLMGGKFRGMLGLSTMDGPRHWRDDDIALVRVLGEVLGSVLERQCAKNALAESQERLRLTIEGLEDGIFDWSIKTGVVVVSDYWLRMLGLPPGQNQRHIDDTRELIHPEDRLRVSLQLERHLKGARPIFEAECRMRHADGGYRWTLSRGRVIQRDDEGQPVRMVCVDRDITEAIDLREQRQKLQNQLAHLSRVSAMGETVAGIAHEVNQPLHAAATYSAAARRALEAGKQDKVKELSQKVSEQIDRAASIIRRMRDFTRSRPAEMAPTDINELLRRSAEFVIGVSRSWSPRVTFKLKKNLPPVACDPVQIQQVVVNLIQNGLDAIEEARPEEGRLTLRTRLEEGAVVIQVTDNGAGCSVSKLDEIFEAFVSTKAEGMGIGLSLSRSIVEQHGGEISAARNDDGGMTFTVRLPLTQADTS